MKKIILAILLLTLVGCSSPVEITPTLTPMPPSTITHIPTAIPAPTTIPTITPSVDTFDYEQYLDIVYDIMWQEAILIYETSNLMDYVAGDHSVVTDVSWQSQIINIGIEFLALGAEIDDLSEPTHPDLKIFHHEVTKHGDMFNDVGQQFANFDSNPTLENLLNIMEQFREMTSHIEVVEAALPTHFP